jgi:hypothetical protein
MKVNIDLSMSHKNMGPVELPVEHYPSFHYVGEEPLEIPHEGTMVIRYKKTSSSMSKGPSGETYSCTVDVKEIVSVEGKKGAEVPSKRDRSAEESLDKLMSEKEKKSESY